jgi:hypothetical protein
MHAAAADGGLAVAVAWRAPAPKAVDTVLGQRAAAPGSSDPASRVQTRPRPQFNTMPRHIFLVLEKKEAGSWPRLTKAPSKGDKHIKVWGRPLESETRSAVVRQLSMQWNGTPPPHQRE